MYFFDNLKGIKNVSVFSSPFIEERLYFDSNENYGIAFYEFSSPFIEERLYFKNRNFYFHKNKSVLVPFYRGAVVFIAMKILSL